MAEEKDTGNDLPLSANLQDITVKHFVLDLACHMEQQVFEGSVTLWCLPAQTQETPAENQQNTTEYDVTAYSAEKNDSSNELLPSDAFPKHCRRASQTGRVQSEASSSDRCLLAVGQAQCMDTEMKSSPVSINHTCFSSSPVSDNNESTDRMVGKVPQTSMVKDSQETFAEPAPGGRNGLFVCDPFQRHSCDCETDRSRVDTNTLRTDLQEICNKCGRGKRESGILEDSTSSYDPYFVTLDTEHCQEHLTKSNRSLNTEAFDSHHHMMSLSANSEINVSDVVQRKTAVQLCAPQVTPFFSHDSEFQITDTHERLRSDLDCGTATTNTALLQKTESMDDKLSSVLQTTSSFSHHNHLSVSSEKKTLEQSEPFRMILDSHKLDIHRVEGVYLQGDDRLRFERHPDTFVQQIGREDGVLLSRHSRCQMGFRVKESCVHVFVEGAYSPLQFPQAVQIWYRTPPLGPSLMWNRDQDDHPCVFTLGHFLSNRSLFPSQDFPTALMTWQASVTVDPGLTVLLTGDADPHVTVNDDGKKTFSYYTQFPMPSCTFAIAVGSWTMEILQYGSLPDQVDCRNMDRPQIRLFFPRRLKEKSLSVLGDYLPRCMLEVQGMLGRYPFHRLDVLLVPACFDSLGMASPSLLFLSQSLLCGDGSMCVRVAHELCHTWFGLIMGPRDWTEEWMTEGFCTYLEDILHARVTQLGEASEDYLGLRSELHLRMLKAEMENTDESLQSLRPNKSQGDPQFSGEETRFLKNGMNVEKKFMQVHYLKGYFLLRALEMEVGRARFLSFLKEYVDRYFCQLVTSQEFLQMFFSTFPGLTHLSVESINADWLDCPGMPKKLCQSAGKDRGDSDRENALSIQVQQELTSITRICRSSKRKRRYGGRPSRIQQLPELNQMLTPQVLLLLDRLLDEELVPGPVLDLLRRAYNAHLENAEVCHRWCELVIKHRHRKWCSDVEHFLIHHQALGVYLYGEASISRCPEMIRVAQCCFRQLQHDMPESVRHTVSAMLFGT